MKFLIFLIFAVLFSFCECRKWELHDIPNLKILITRYFDQKYYEDVTDLKIYFDRNTLEKNEIIKLDFLERFPNIEKLNIDSFDFNSFEEIKFATKLKELFLARNKIQKLQENQLTNLINLEVLDLSDNLIKNVYAGYLNKNTKLKRISFSNNHITEIPKDCFKNLYELEYINFSNNQLKVLPSLLFQDNKEIKYINFKNNQIKNIHHALFKGCINLSYADFSDNPCENCKVKWKHSELIVVDYDDTGENSIVETNVTRFKRMVPDREIHLKRDFQNLNQTFFTQTSYEETGLKITPGTYFTPSYLDVLQIDFLEKFPQLEKLFIGKFFFGSVQQILFGNRIKQLTLWQNKFKMIPEHCFDNLQYLEYLNLGENALTNLCGCIFKENQKLKTITFYDNKIKKIPSRIFSELTELEDVSFRNNQIEYLAAVFKDNRKLKKVNFRDNKIKSIEPKIFEGLQLEESRFDNNLCTLGIIGLENCFDSWDKSGLPHTGIDDTYVPRIKEEFVIEKGRLKYLRYADVSQVEEVIARNFHSEYFPNEIIERFPKLNFLRFDLMINLDKLNGNFFFDNLQKITTLKIYRYDGRYEFENFYFVFLHKFPNLEKIIINQYDFHRIQKNIEFHENIRKIDFSNNQITQLRRNIFENSKNLIAIDFHDNRINTLHRELFSELKNLEIVIFAENEIKYLWRDLFKNNKNLRQINFECNKIKMLSPTFFDGLKPQNKLFIGNPCVDNDENFSKTCFDLWSESIDEIHISFDVSNCNIEGEMKKSIIYNCTNEAVNGQLVHSEVIVPKTKNTDCSLDAIHVKTENWVYIPKQDGTWGYVDLNDQVHALFDSDEEVKFLLYTRKNFKEPQIIKLKDINSVEESYFDKENPTRILVHGFLNDNSSDFNVLIRQAYLRSGDFNVIVVDWGAGSKNLAYYPSKERTVDVGKTVADFVNYLHSKGFLDNFDNLNLVGHSLGAHVVGIAGKKMIEKAKVIYGLDPAKPLFFDSDPQLRFDKTDAQLTVSLNTNIALWGYGGYLAQMHFLPNGGNFQNGCDEYSLSCSHSRAYEYFAESLESRSFIAGGCKSIEELTYKGYCTQTGEFETFLGENIKANPGVFYFKTKNSPPYGLGGEGLP